MSPPRTRTLGATLALAATVLACRAEAPADRAPGTATREANPPLDAPGRVVERGVVFLGSVGDSSLTVLWLFTAHTRPGGVDRRARAWLARGNKGRRRFVYYSQFKIKLIILLKTYLV